MTNLIAVRRLWMAFSCLLLVVTAPLAMAQDDGPAGVSVRIVSVKPGAEAQFEAAIADLTASLGEQGRAFYHVYQRERGDNLPSYTLITQDAVFGGVPEADIDPSIIDRIVNSTRTSNLMTVQVDPELGIQGGGGFEPPAQYLRTRIRVTSPQMRQDFIDWQTDAADLFEEAGLDDMRVGRIVLGGDPNVFIIWTFQDDMSLGLPGVDIPGTVGTERAQELFQRLSGMLVGEEEYILRFRDDLSFTAAQ